MALRVGYRGPCSDVRAEQKLLDAFWWIVDSCMARIAGQGTPLGALVGLGRNYSWIGPAMPARAVRQAINNQLRTGTDKGNPTV